MQKLRSLKATLLYSFLIWLIPFFISIFIYPLKEENNPLFESIMPVILTLATFSFTLLYFKKTKKDFLFEGIVIGALFFLVSIVIDLFMFMWGPMKMSLLDYIKDIGLTYIIILAIPIFSGYMLKEKIPKSEEK